MGRRCARLLLAALFSLLVVDAATLPASSYAQQPEEGVGPDEVENVAPCCRARVQVPPAERRAAGQVDIPWEGTGVDPVTWERLKAEARMDPRAPLAHELSDVDSARAPGIEQSFAGIIQGEIGLSASPPDTTLAVGPDNVIEAVNLAVRLMDRQGNSLAEHSLHAHFGFVASGASSDPVITDPKLYYDAMSDRFFLLMLAIDFNLNTFARAHLSISRSGSPAGLGEADWCNYEISTKKGDTWGDYPGLGMNERWLAFSTNNFAFSGFSLQSRLYVADKASLVDNANRCPSAKFFKFNLGLNNTADFNPQPVQHYEETGLPGNPLFAVSSDVLGGTTYTLFRIAGKKNSRGSKPRLTRETLVAGDIYTIPPTATQKGGSKEVDTGDARVMQQAVYRHGRLWFTHATGCRVRGSATNQSCVRVVRVNVGEKDAVIDFEQTLGKKREHYWWPGVVVTPGGAVVVAFQRSGDTKLLGVSYSGISDGTAVRVGLRKGFDKVRSAVSGECTLQTEQFVVLANGEVGVRVRSGDYVGLAPDPVTEDVWMAGEHGKLAFGGFSCIWGTMVTRVRY